MMAFILCVTRAGIFLTSGSEIRNFRFMKIAHFRFEGGNGSRKYDVATVQSQLLIPQKFDQNRSTGVRVMSP